MTQSAYNYCMTQNIIVIAHNIRSAHNIGALMRTMEGLGVGRLYITGYSPYPHAINDQRLPHIAQRANKQIVKTALGAEKYLKWEYENEIEPLLARLKRSGYELVGLEQTPRSIEISDFQSHKPLALLLGSEPSGIDEVLMDRLDCTVHIPMKGKKESFNVVEAAAIAVYELTTRASTNSS